MRRVHQFGLVLALGASGLLVACDAAHGPLAADDGLIAAAPNLTPEGLLEGLELDPTQEAHVTQKLESLHDVMLEAHELGTVDRELTADEKQAMHEKLMYVHEQHDDLMGSFTAEQQHQFMQNAHDLMAEKHAAEGDLDELHEKMKRHHGHDGDEGHGPGDIEGH